MLKLQNSSGRSTIFRPGEPTAPWDCSSESRFARATDQHFCERSTKSTSGEMFRCHLSSRQREKKGKSTDRNPAPPLSSSIILAAISGRKFSGQRKLQVADSLVSSGINDDWPGPCPQNCCDRPFHNRRPLAKTRRLPWAGLVRHTSEPAGEFGGKRCPAATRQTAALPFFDVVEVALQGIEEPAFCRKPLDQHILLNDRILRRVALGIRTAFLFWPILLPRAVNDACFPPRGVDPCPKPHAISPLSRIGFAPGVRPQPGRSRRRSCWIILERLGTVSRGSAIDGPGRFRRSTLEDAVGSESLRTCLESFGQSVWPYRPVCLGHELSGDARRRPTAARGDPES